MQRTQVHDDLKKIPGLGEACQKWLAEVLGVRTYKDLAALSFEEIEPIKAKIKSIDLELANKWPEEAKERAAKQANLSNLAAVENPITQVGNPSGKENDNEESIGPKSQDKPWKSIAMFMVEFRKRRLDEQTVEHQTKVKYLETEECDTWDGIEIQQIGSWMVKQAGSKLYHGLLETLTVGSESEQGMDEDLPERIALTLTELRFYQPTGVEAWWSSRKDEKQYAGVIQADQSFDVVFTLEIDDQMTEIIRKQEIAYQVQFFLQNRDTKEKVHIGDTQPDFLCEEQTHYSAELTGIMLRPGTYRLQAVVISEVKSVVPSYFELPRFHVVRPRIKPKNR